VTAVPLTEAARRCGYASRSQIYRLLDAGALRDYERSSSKGARLLELEPGGGLPSLVERVRECTQQRVNSRVRARKAKDADAQAHVDVVTMLWEPITPSVNQELVAAGFPAVTPEQLLTVWRAAEAAIARERPEFDFESRQWWAATLADASPGDPCPDPWRCEHCGEPWHSNHPEFRHSQAMESYLADVRQRLI